MSHKLVNVPQKLTDKVDREVKKKGYLSRADYVRHAIVYYMNHKEKLDKILKYVQK